MSKTKVNFTSAEITEKWKSRLKNSIPDIQRGVNAVTDSPMTKAVAKQEKMKQNLIQSIDNGRWAAGLNAVSLQQWKDITTKKISSSLSAGVDAATAKHQKFSEYLITTVNGGLSTISSMPDMTIDDSANRAVAFMKYMANNKYKK
jgi:hypothetical protein